MLSSRRETALASRDAFAKTPHSIEKIFCLALISAKKGSIWANLLRNCRTLLLEGNLPGHLTAFPTKGLQLGEDAWASHSFVLVSMSRSFLAVRTPFHIDFSHKSRR